MCHIFLKNIPKPWIKNDKIDEKTIEMTIFKFVGNVRKVRNSSSHWLNWISSTIDKSPLLTTNNFSSSHDKNNFQLLWIDSLGEKYILNQRKNLSACAFQA